MRLWLRVALVVAVVSVSALLVSGAVAVQVAGSSATRAAVEAQERDAGAIGARVGRWLDEQTDVLLGWALAFPLGELDEVRRENLARAVLVGVPSTVTVALVDEDGGLVAPAAFFAEGAPGARGAPVRADALVRRLPLTAALGDPGGVAVGEAYDTDPPSVPVAIVASRAPTLLLAAELSLVFADELAQQSGPERAIVLVDAHGHGLVGADHPLVDLDRVLPVLGTRAHFSYRTGTIGVRGAIAPAGRAGWSVLVLEPEEVASRAADAIWWLIVPVVGGSMLASIAVGVVLARSVTEPVGRLRDTVQALADGQYGIHASVGGSDEVGELARAFDAMSDRLLANQSEIQRQRQEIEGFNLELQQRIDDAVRDLRAAQEQLVRSGQLAAVAQLGAGLAHELNNPLMAVVGIAQLLDARATDPEVRVALADLLTEATRCRRVVHTMLELSDAPPLGVDVAERSSLAGLIGAVREAVGASVRRRGVELVWEALPAADVQVPHLVGVRALGALVDALAAGLPDGGRLVIGAAAREDEVDLTLSPDRPVDPGRDDWMAFGLEVWVARQTLDALGARLHEPEDGSTAWRVRLRRAPGGVG